MNKQSKNSISKPGDKLKRTRLMNVSSPDLFKKSKADPHPHRIKQLKTENKELMLMIKENDRLMTARLRES